MYIWKKSICLSLNFHVMFRNKAEIQFVSSLKPAEIILLQAAQRTDWVPSSSPSLSQAFSWWTSCFLSTLTLSFELPLKVCQQFSIPEAGCSADSSKINTVFFVHSGQSWRCQAPGGDLEEGHMNGDTPQCYLNALSWMDTGTHNTLLQTFFSMAKFNWVSQNTENNVMHLFILSFTSLS